MPCPRILSWRCISEWCFVVPPHLLWQLQKSHIRCRLIIIQVREICGVINLISGPRWSCCWWERTFFTGQEPEHKRLLFYLSAHGVASQEILSELGRTCEVLFSPSMQMESDPHPEQKIQQTAVLCTFWGFLWFFHPLLEMCTNCNLNAFPSKRPILIHINRLAGHASSSHPEIIISTRVQIAINFIYLLYIYLCRFLLSYSPSSNIQFGSPTLNVKTTGMSGNGEKRSFWLIELWG